MTFDVYKNRFYSFTEYCASKAWIAGSLFVLWGLFASYYLSIKSGFKILPGDNGDGWLNQYFLEYSWYWLTGKIGGSYWDAPFFYPFKNTMAFSDTLLGAAPIYWLFRALSLGSDTAYLLWPACLGILNWLCMYYLLRKPLRMDILPAATGAFLFAFCMPRLIKLGHIQFWPHFFTPLFIILLIFFYRNFESRPWLARLSLAGCPVCAALQFYAGFYLGWFLAFGCCVFLFVAMALKNTRSAIIETARKTWPWLCLALVLFILLAWPLAAHYLQTQKMFGQRPWDEILLMLPTFSSWFATHSVLYRDFIDYGRPRCFEHLIGFGWLGLPIAIYGLYLGAKQNVWLKCLAIAGLIIFILLSESFAGLHLWSLAAEFFPGAGAIRAISRIFYLYLIIFAIGYAFVMQGKKLWLQIALALLLLVENAGPGYMFQDKRQNNDNMAAVAEEAKKAGLPFVYISDGDRTNVKHLTAMWASLKTGRQTYNGYSGQIPEDGRYNVADMPASEIAKSEFLAKIKEPYLLIARKDGAVRSAIIRSPKDLLDFGNMPGK